MPGGAITSLVLQVLSLGRNLIDQCLGSRPPLKWLIDLRVRVASEIEEIEGMLAECQRLAEKILPRKELLSSID